MEWIATTMRRIWLKRNKLIFENKFCSPWELILKLSEGLEDFKPAHMTVKENNSDRVRGNPCKRWKKPDINEIKVYWDAALDINNKKMGLEIVIRDVEGEVFASVCSKRSNIVQPELLECLALWKTLEICNELGFSKVIIEWDATVVIYGVNSVE